MQTNKILEVIIIVKEQIRAQLLNVIYAQIQQMNLQSHSVDICIAGNVYTNGCNSLGKRLYVLYVKVEYLKINLFLYLQKKIKQIPETKIRIKMGVVERMGKAKIFQIDLVDKEVSHNQIKITTMVLEHLVVVIIISSEIQTVGLLWVQAYFLHYFH